MPVNIERIRERLLYIREQVSVLEPLSKDADLRASRMRDQLSYSGIVRNLQTSIEAMIDIAFHLCAKLYAKEPESAAHAFEILAERGDVPKEFLPRVLEMVRFRNLVVHGYLHTKPELVEKIITDDLGDFAAWEKIISQLASHKKWNKD